MKQQGTKKHQRWHLLHQTRDEGGQKSISSKDSLVHARYTPAKSITSSQSKLNLASLKHRPAPTPQTSSRILPTRSKHNTDSSKPENKSVLVEPVSLKMFVWRADSIDSENVSKGAASGIGVSGEGLGNRSGEGDFVIQGSIGVGRGREEDQELRGDKGEYFLRELKKSQGMMKPAQLEKMDTFTDQLEQPPFPKTQRLPKYPPRPERLPQEAQHPPPQPHFQPVSHPQPQPYPNLTTESLFQHCLSALTVLEQYMISQRIQVHRLLEEKHRKFAEFKERLFRTFAKKQKQIKKETNREVLRDYLPRDQQREKNTLTRITSERVFNRFQKDGTIQHKLSGFQRDNSASAYGRKSANSRTDSICKKNFDRIFDTISKLKSQLSDDPFEHMLKPEELRGTDRQNFDQPLNQTQRKQRYSIYYGNTDQKVRKSAPNSNPILHPYTSKINSIKNLIAPPNQFQIDPQNRDRDEKQKQKQKEKEKEKEKEKVASKRYNPVLQSDRKGTTNRLTHLMEGYQDKGARKEYRV